MSLISCPDCKRRVSNLAPACPTCARPIAGDLEHDAVAQRQAIALPPQSKSSPTTAAESKGLDPVLLGRIQRERVTANVTGVLKTCAKCGRDVTDDLFRIKDEQGYTCVDCHDVDMDNVVEWRARWSRRLWVALSVLFVGVTIVGAVSLTSKPPPTGGSSIKK